jgi:hypothetical protein
MALSLIPHSINLDVLHPISKEPIGLVLTLIGQDHDEHHQFLADYGNSLREKGVTEAETKTDEFQKQFVLQSLNAYIIGWEVKSESVTAMFNSIGIISNDYSKESSLILLSAKGTRYIREQLVTVVTERQSFFEVA